MTIELAIPLILFIVLLILRVHIAICFALSGMVGITLLRSFESAVSTLGLAAYSETSNYILLSIPLFTFMGNLLFASGLAKQLYEFAYKWSGKLPGSLAYATIVACTFFGACTGSAMAAVATIGPVALDEMESRKYSSKLAYGCITSSASLGIMIPPSLAFIVYGYICEVPIGPQFIAGILPGILISLLLVGLVFYMICRDPSIAPASQRGFSWKEKFVSVKGIWWVFVIFMVVVGGMWIGIFTATEAAAVGTVASFLCMLVARSATWKVLVDALRETARTSCMIFTIIIGAKIFNTYLGVSGLPQDFVDYMSNLPVSRYLIMAIILFLYIPLGCFIDSVPMFFLTLPIIFPIIDKLGFDHLQFGVLVTLMAQIASLTPPVGMNVYVLSGISRRPLGECFAGSVPFLIPMCLSVVILVIFPQISTFLPHVLKW